MKTMGPSVVEILIQTIPGTACMLLTLKFNINSYSYASWPIPINALLNQIIHPHAFVFN